MHIRERDEPSGKRDVPRRPANLPDPKILRRTRAALAEGHLEGIEFSLVPTRADPRNQPSA